MLQHALYGACGITWVIRKLLIGEFVGPSLNFVELKVEIEIVMIHVIYRTLLKCEITKLLPNSKNPTA